MSSDPGVPPGGYGPPGGYPGTPGGYPAAGYGNYSPKSRLAAALLCWFVGVLGVHRFYVGKVGTGLLQLFTIGGLGIWTLIDLIMILVGSFKDKEGRTVALWTTPN